MQHIISVHIITYVSIPNTLTAPPPLLTGVGKNVDMTELVSIGGGRSAVFLVPDYFSLWKTKTAIMKKAKLSKITFITLIISIVIPVISF